MNRIERRFFDEFPSTELMFIDKVNNIFWKNWKKFDECNEEEEINANLRTIFPNEIIIDLEDKNEVGKIKNELIKDKYEFLICDSGSRGNHIHLFFYNLTNYSEEVRNKIREKFIKKYGGDLTKSIEHSLIARIDKPHFKTMKEKTIIENNIKEYFNLIPKEIISELRKELEELEKKKSLLNIKDEDFKDYHLKDIFFKYISENIIPDNMERNNTIFPNLAIALVKEGLTEEQIKELMEPIIKKNFPGKIYNEFYGWVKKAFNRDIETYNTIQINRWLSNYAKKEEMYDVKPLDINDLLKEETTDKNKLKRIYTYKEYQDLQLPETKWLIESWLPQGDISFLVGKAASFKTTVCLHFAFAIAEDKLVFNNYKVIQSKVLYLNEENNNAVVKGIAERVIKGLNLETTNNVHISTFQNFKIDKVEDILYLIDYINKNEIKVLILDSFRRFFLGEENDATLMNVLFDSLKILRTRCQDLTIIILHHLKKDSGNRELDIRDMLRGSSDIVNSADSIIGIKRKTGKEILTIEHIKNRCALESVGKVIAIEDPEKKNIAYFRELKDIRTTENKSDSEKAAEILLSIIENLDILDFTRKDITDERINDFSYDVITRAFRLLCQDGTLSVSGGGRYTKYHFNKVLQTEL